MNPICSTCSRNARTVDTPKVKVRVERCLVMRDQLGLKLLWRCHGAHGMSSLPEGVDEDYIASLEVAGHGEER